MPMPAGATATPVATPPASSSFNYQALGSSLGDIGKQLAASLGGGGASASFTRSQGEGFQPVAATFTFPTLTKARPVYG